jgi:hypothetical protein
MTKAHTYPGSLAAMSAAAAAVREVGEQRLVGLSAVQDALRESQGLRPLQEVLTALRAGQGLNTTSELLSEWRLAQGFESSLTKSLRAISEASETAAVAAVPLRPEWTEQVRKTLDALGAHVLSPEVREVLAQSRSLSSTLVVTNALRTALEEAERIAEPVELEQTAGPLAQLSEAQRVSLQVALLGAMVQIASNVAFFVGSRRLDMAANFLALLVVVVTLYHAAQPPANGD